MKPTILPAPAGLEMLEIHGDEVFRAAVLALAYDADRGLVPLGAGDRIDSTVHAPVALVTPSGRVEMAGECWPSVEAFCASKGLKEHGLD